MKHVLFLLMLSLLLCGCGASASENISETIPQTAPVQPEPKETIPSDPLQQLLESMSLEDRVGQLFLVRCQADTALQDIKTYHFGGFVLFGMDFQDQTPETITDTIAAYQSAAKVPMLMAVDEEGGTVTRISQYPQFRSEPFPSPRSLYAQGGMALLSQTEIEKCQLLGSLGLNVNLAPVCDITTQPGAVLYDRSLGQSADITSELISQTVTLMTQNKIGSVLKHFPGYGNNADTHVEMARDSRSLEELESCDLLPFAAGIHAGADAIMVSHTIVEALDSELPASLSPAVHTYLRSNMGFDGVILTDDLAMGAITEQYGSGEAAVLAVLAGNDLICCTDYAVQYEAVLEAVLSGRISYYQLTDSVLRILKWKQALGLL